jgi:outer membrane murein-binding lipoprotein Lpp
MTRAARPLSRFELSFQGEAFYVPKKSLFDFFETHPDLMTSKSYDVQSSVPIDIFREFVSSLNTDSILTATQENAASLGLLASEFCFDDLAAECAKLTHDPLTSLEKRVTQLEARVPFPPHAELLDLHEEKLEQFFSQLQTLNSAVSQLSASVSAMKASSTEQREADRRCGDAISRLEASRRDLQGQLERTNASVSGLQGDMSRLEAFQGEAHAELNAVIGRIRYDCASSHAASQKGIEELTECVSRLQSNRLFDFHREKPLDGIIAYLTAKCGGNVHDAGIVELTPSSIEGDNLDHRPKWVLDEGNAHHFGTKNERNPWLCFDFKDMRIIPTHYTIVTDHDSSGWWAQFTTSWVIEVSMDGSNWVTIDERRDVEEADGPDRTISFAVSSLVLCQYLRIRRTTGRLDFNAFRDGGNSLEMKRFEVFGRVIA